MLGGTIIIEKNAFIHVSTHAEGGTVIIKGDVEGRVGGQMVKGEMYVLGKIKFMLPGYKKVDTVEKECRWCNLYLRPLHRRPRREARKEQGPGRVREPVPEGGMNLRPHHITTVHTGQTSFFPVIKSLSIKGVTP